MDDEGDERAGVADTAVTALSDASRRVPPMRVPTILEEDPNTATHRFASRPKRDIENDENVASQRRGRFVIKLAATLFLAGHDDFDTPGKCAVAMSHLWGHTRLGEEYLRHSNYPCAPKLPYTSQQLAKAENQWKAALGNKVLEKDEFYKCWLDLKPFFRRCIKEVRRDEDKSASVVVSKKTASSSKDDDSSNALIKGLGQFIPAAVSHTLLTATPADHTGAFFDNLSKPTLPRTVAFLDLAKVRASGFTLVFDKMLGVLRLASAGHHAVPVDATPDAVFLASRGWLPLRHRRRLLQSTSRQNPCDAVGVVIHRAC
jgi:hypothetical protein